MNELSFQDFLKVDIRVGTITRVSDFVKARKPAWILSIDFGSEIGVLKTSAQLKELYSENDLLGKQILAVVNFPPKQIANIQSQCLVLAVVGDDQGTVLLEVEREVANGLRVG